MAAEKEIACHTPMNDDALDRRVIDGRGSVLITCQKQKHTDGRRSSVPRQLSVGPSIDGW